MRKHMIAAGALALLALGACKKENQVGVPERSLIAATNITLASGATLPRVVGADTNYILQNGGTYFLNGKTYVDSLGALTIHGRVTVKGIKKATPAEASALVITRGGKIYANGKPDSVIVFTSNEASPLVGDWGGVVILGKAQTNKVNPTIEGIDLPTLPAGINVGYGSTGTTFNNDTSGVFKYVRIEYAGAAISPNNELNSLTLGGVGSGTELHHVQASYGADDAFEFFGGTVNASYLVSLNTNDDIFDFDFGYKGKLQFILGIRRSTGTGAVYNSDANGIESDNDGDGTTATPRTEAEISNMTLISGNTATIAGTKYAARWRRASGLRVKNSVILGYDTAAVFESAGSIAFKDSLKYSLVHAFKLVSNQTLHASNTTFTNPASSNAGIQLSNPFGVGGLFQPYPTATSPARMGANFAGFTPGFFTTTIYRGAFPQGSKVWLNGWTAGL